MKKFCILDWMSGERTYKETEKDIVSEFKKLKKKALENNEEFDMSCLKIIDEYNNID